MPESDFPFLQNLHQVTLVNTELEKARQKKTTKKNTTSRYPLYFQRSFR